MLYIITFTNVKKQKDYPNIFKDLSTRYDSFFDYDENRSLPFKRSLRNFDKELEEAKIYFYIYEDTKNIGT